MGLAVLDSYDVEAQAEKDPAAGFRSGRRAKIRHDCAALFSKQAPEYHDG